MLKSNVPGSSVFSFRNVSKSKSVSTSPDVKGLAKSNGPKSYHVLTDAITGLAGVGLTMEPLSMKPVPCDGSVCGGAGTGTGVGAVAVACPLDTAGAALVPVGAALLLKLAALTGVMGVAGVGGSGSAGGSATGVAAALRFDFDDF